MSQGQVELMAEERDLLIDFTKAAGSTMTKLLTELGAEIERNALTTRDAAEAALKRIAGDLDYISNLAIKYALKADEYDLHANGRMRDLLEKKSMELAEVAANLQNVRYADELMKAVEANSKYSGGVFKRVVGEAGGVLVDAAFVVKHLLDHDSKEVAGDFGGILGGLAGYSLAVWLGFNPVGITALLIGAGMSMLWEYGIEELYDDLVLACTDFFEWLDPLGWMDFDVNEFYREARNWLNIDPLAIDLDGDGIETVGADGSVLFDFNGDGIKTGTGWVAADDALLVMDRDGNGSIDTGAELFGVDTVKSDGTLAADGFDALSDLDTNGDGVFDAQDEAFGDVRIWRDLDQDGVSDAGELTSLADAGIASIDLNAQSGNVNLGNGNVLSAVSAHLTTEGESGTTGNLDLAQNPFYSEFTDSVELTEEAKDLPDSRGSGAVRSLREAMSLSPELAATVAEFSAQSTYAEQHARMDGLITKWADSSTMKTSIELASENGFMLTYMIPDQEAEDFFQTFSTTQGGDSDSNSGLVSEEEYAEQLEKAALMERQEEIVRMLETLEKFNGEQFVTVEEESVTTGAGQTILSVADDTEPDADSGGSGGWNGLLIKKAFVRLTQTQIYLLTQSYERLKESVYGNLIIQTRLSDYTDEIALDISDSGDIVLDYSGVTAMLETRRGADPVNAFADLVEFVRYQGAALSKLGWDSVELLRTWIEESGEEEAVAALLKELNVAVSDGDSIGDKSSEITFHGDSAGEINGMDGHDVIDAGEGNDRVYGDAGDDYLIGGDGSDRLIGGDGDDTLRGGIGADDFLRGDSGNDTYLFGLGDGDTTIYNLDTDPGRNDVLRFLDGIDPSDVRVTRAGENLNLTVGDTDEVITVSYYFREDGTAGYALNAIEFADGTAWDLDTVKAMVQQGSDGEDLLYGFSGSDTLAGFGGDDSLYGDTGNDTISGGEGNDRIYGQDGNDILSGDAGNDTLFGDDGNDVLEGGVGEDYMYGGKGNDTFRGGPGTQDFMRGDAGNDTYLFGLGDGKARIYNQDTDVGRNDVLRFLEGIDPSDVRATRVQDTLLLTIQSTGEVVRVDYYFRGDGIAGYALDAVEFADGTVWDMDMVKTLVQQGTEGVDQLYGYAVADTLDGLGGDDTLYGANGNDTLSGGDGKDRIYGQNDDDIINGDAGNDALFGDDGNDVLDGGDGDDWISGGKGDDILRGGAGTQDFMRGDAGNDTYLFGLGDGKASIHNQDTGVGREDVLRFLEGIDPNDVRATRSQDSLLLTIQSTGEVVRVNYFFRGDGAAGYGLDAVEFADGTVWDMETVKALVQQGSEGVDQLYGYAEADTLNGLDGDDTLYGADGNDTLSGGDGKDRVYGQNGDDILSGNAGNDTLFGDDGDDVLEGGDGDDWISGGKSDDILRGGAGNDFLRGDAGNDTYLFSTGDGVDTIYNNDTAADSVDVARFESTSIEDLWFSRNGNNLEITVAGTDDKMTFSNWYGNAGNQIDRIETGSSVLLNSQVEQLVSAMASYNVPSGVGNVIPQDVKDTLQPVLAATWQTV